MRSKTDFYRLFFEQLARRGFDVKRSQSSDYIADIYFKNQLVAYFSKADTVIQNPFVTVKDKLIRLINDTAQDTANKAGICRDCPYTDANEKLPNGSYKLAEYNGVTLACKEHHLFGYVFSTYRTAPDSGEMMARQIFYNKEFAGQDFAKRSGLVDERALFTEEELRVLHAGLVKMSILDQDVSNEARESVERILDKIEDIIPELREQEMEFDFDMEFGQQEEMEIGGFLMYKYGLNQQLEGMTDEEYMAHPIGLDVGQYVADLMKYCPEHIVDQVMEHQDALLRRLGTDYLTVIAYMPYEEDGGTKYA